MLQRLNFANHDHIRPGISAADRALIDAAIAAGLVQVIPMGKSAMDEFGNLPQAKPLLERRTEGLVPRDETDRKLLALLNTGMPQRRAAFSLGLGLSTVVRRMRDMRAPKEKKPTGRPKMDLQIPRILELRAEGKNNQQVADEMGLTIHALRKRLRTARKQGDL